MAPYSLLYVPTPHSKHCEAPEPWEGMYRPVVPSQMSWLAKAPWNGTRVKRKWLTGNAREGLVGGVRLANASSGTNGAVRISIARGVVTCRSWIGKRGRKERSVVIFSQQRKKSTGRPPLPH